MTEERVTTTENPDGSITTTRTTSVGEREPRSGGGIWLIAIVLLIAIVAGFFIFNNMSGAEVAKDTAIADAANDVGDAAQQVGDAAQDAADNLTGGE
ncbi:hypothetical protein [Erythrobacter litoralis]|uniref:Uncharacterized protein n=1 Tax=Erythrobacter litoralis (strain HTCC2594) TaxID=314225 RepID=Q2NAY7_ERYLH|nr:hypothetical protein [Erythrobacter litoralis]ABC63154.1 hypothetical protein ELI_05310 [Erythrobacter litoralis HTCC2594]